MKVAVWIVAAGTLAGLPGFDTMMLAPLLLCIAVDIADARFFASVPSVIAKTAVILIAAWFHPSIGILIASATFDLAMVAPIAIVAIPVAAVAAIAQADLPAPDRIVLVVLVSVIGAIAGWIARRHAASRSRHVAAIDGERASRYRLA